MLVAAHGDVVTKHDLQKAAWGSAGTHDDNRLQAHVRRLRSKLTDPAGDPSARLRTVRGVGFRLEPPRAYAGPRPGDPRALDPRPLDRPSPTDLGENVHEATETVARRSGPRR